MNNRKKLIYILVAIIIISITAILLKIKDNNNENNETKEKNNIICEKITISKNKKETFIVFINSDSINNGDSNNAIRSFKNKYKNLTIYEINSKKLKENCIGTVLEDTGLYEDFKTSNIPAFIGYYKGEYKGTHQNPSELGIIEEYFLKVDIIETTTFKETGITYEEFEQNITMEDYILVVIADEESREIVDKTIKENFQEIKYDIVNYTSDEGRKILNKIKETEEVEQAFPRIFYFKNGQHIANSKCPNNIYLKKFKKTIEKYN